MEKNEYSFTIYLGISLRAVCNGRSNAFEVSAHVRLPECVCKPCMCFYVFYTLNSCG